MNNAVYNRQAKAESLIVNRIGYRPTNRNVPSSLALKGRHQDSALSGLRFCAFCQDRALPYPIDNKAFSLSLTATTISIFSNENHIKKNKHIYTNL